MRGCCEHAVDEHAEDLLAGRRAGDVEHAAARVSAFEPGLGIERHAEVVEVGDPCGRLPHQRPDGALAAKAATGAHRVLRVQLGAVAVTRRRGHAALREIAGGRAQRPLREQQHVRFVTHAQRGVQAGDATADDGEIAAHDRVRSHSGSFSLRVDNS